MLSYANDCTGEIYPDPMIGSTIFYEQIDEDDENPDDDEEDDENDEDEDLEEEDNQNLDAYLKKLFS